MPSAIASNHPTQRLLFFVAQEITDLIRTNVRSFVDSLARSREWVIRPPKIIDAIDYPKRPDLDAAIETVGGYLDIYSAMPPLQLPRDIDRQHLEEVTYLVEATRVFSKAQALTFEFELDGKFVGSIEAGSLDRSLSEGLLGEWNRHLGG
jgi:hypothetical protein